MKKILKFFLLPIILLLLIIAGYFFVGKAPQIEKITWAVTFSQKQTKSLDLDWKEVYLALLDDLKVKKIRIIAYWDLIEPKEDKYDFTDLDWQIAKAEEKGAKLVLTIGMKTPRWPECHIPVWLEWRPAAKEKLLAYIKKIVNRYKNSSAISAWQVENEPFFKFGECPKSNKALLEKEIVLVKSLDNRPIIVSDTGEWSFWTRAGKYGDMVGITIYRKLWFEPFKNYVKYPFPPAFYYKRAKLIKKIFDKEVICLELQAEPWGPTFVKDMPLQEQKKTMDLEKFKKNIEFAKKTGLSRFYFWGAEWWYWLKEKQGDPEIWNEAMKLF